MRTSTLSNLLRCALVVLLAIAACKKEGPKTVCGGIQGKTCPEGQRCDNPPGQCNVADAQGVCLPKPESCNRRIEPVCGCDGVSYGNDCLRQMAGVQKDHEGECQPKG